jgi:hypothetical protein
MSEFKTFMNEHNFETVMINGHQYFRDRKYESDPNYHDCGIIDDEICRGCRACIYSYCELTHSFLVYLIEDLKWSDEKMSKYFDLSYVNLDKHRSQYPGGCQCNFQKMFRNI